MRQKCADLDFFVAITLSGTDAVTCSKQIPLGNSVVFKLKPKKTNK